MIYVSPLVSGTDALNKKPGALRQGLEARTVLLSPAAAVGQNRRDQDLEVKSAEKSGKMRLENAYFPTFAP